MAKPFLIKDLKKRRHFSLWIIIRLISAKKTIIAKVNNEPPSPLKLIPNTRKCEKIAPNMINRLPNMAMVFVFGMRIKIAKINSKTPSKILPKGSTPNSENICTESGWAVNL